MKGRKAKLLEPMSIRLAPDVKASLQAFPEANMSLSACVNRVLRERVRRLEAEPHRRRRPARSQARALAGP